MDFEFETSGSDKLYGFQRLSKDRNAWKRGCTDSITGVQSATHFPPFQVIRDSNRLITFLDLAGHSKYQRTTLSGLTTFQPAFCILVVSATTGLTADGLRHARTAAALGLPLVVVLSKVDLTSEGLVAFPQPKASITSAARFITIDTNAGDVVEPCPVLTNIQTSVLQELRTIKFYSGDGSEESLKIAE